MFVSLPSFDFVFDELFRATRGLEPKVCFLELVMQPGMVRGASYSGDAFWGYLPT